MRNEVSDILEQPLYNATVTVTVTKVFIMRFLLKERKCSTKSFTHVQRSPD